MWFFMYIKEKTLGENYKEAYELWRERNPLTRRKIGAKLLLNQLNWILKAKRTTFGGIDKIKEKISVWNDTEDHRKGMNGHKMYMNDKRKPEEGPRNNNTGLDKIEKNVFMVPCILVIIVI